MRLGPGPVALGLLLLLLFAASARAGQAEELHRAPGEHRAEYDREALLGGQVGRAGPGLCPDKGAAARPAGRRQWDRVDTRDPDLRSPGTGRALDRTPNPSGPRRGAGVSLPEAPWPGRPLIPVSPPLCPAAGNPWSSCVPLPQRKKSTNTLNLTTKSSRNDYGPS